MTSPAQKSKLLPNIIAVILALAVAVLYVWLFGYSPITRCPLHPIYNRDRHQLEKVCFE